jgi:hypothetical protein
LRAAAPGEAVAARARDQALSTSTRRANTFAVSWIEHETTEGWERDDETTGRPGCGAPNRDNIETIVSMLLLLSASPALGSAVTIGPDATGTVNSELGQESEESKTVLRSTAVQVSQPTAGILLTAPADGVITSWRVRGKVFMGSLALRVVRRAADGVRFTGIASSDPISTGLTGAVDHPASIPIQAGDYIGVEAETNMSTTPTESQAFFAFTQATGANYAHWAGSALPNGTTSAPAA